MSAESNALLIGLPSTGKTSFLAALWQVVNDTGANSFLTLDRLDGDSGYLNRIRKAWLDYKPVPRTFMDSEKVVKMVLKSRDSSRLVRLTFPDLSGESFQLQWTTRQFTGAYDELLQRATGAVLFLHPATIVKPHRIDMVDELIEAQEGAEQVDSDAAPGEGSSSLSTTWDIEKAPTQVQVVDLLQFIGARDHVHSPFRVAVVVSAWDLVRPLQVNPDVWISRELPLLRQFLDCNDDRFGVNYYGLSAQGAQYPSWRFSQGSIKNLQAFAKRIIEGTEGVTRWLSEGLAPSVKTGLDVCAADAGNCSDLEVKLIGEMNRLISTGRIDEDNRFTDVAFRPETEALRGMKTVEQGEDMIRLNRLMLEDAFPTLLSQDIQMNDVMAELQLRQPTRRISLIRANGEESCDITEPIQWLMS